MANSELIDRVHNVVHTQLGVELENIKSSSSLISDFGADTLDVVELIMAIEEEFCITIPEDECQSIDTVGDLIRVVSKHKEGIL